MEIVGVVNGFTWHTQYKKFEIFVFQGLIHEI